MRYGAARICVAKLATALAFYSCACAGPVRGVRGTLRGKHAFPVNCGVLSRTEVGDGRVLMSIVLAGQEQGCSKRAPPIPESLLFAYIWADAGTDGGTYVLSAFGPTATNATNAYITSRHAPADRFESFYTIGGTIGLQGERPGDFRVHLDLTFADGERLVGDVLATECPSVPTTQFLHSPTTSTARP